MNLLAGLDEIVKENEPMAKHTWFKLGGPARYFVEPRNEEELLDVTKRCHENEVDILVLGRGSNLLVSDEGIDGVVVHLNDEHFGKVEINESTVTAQAGVDMGNLIGVCARKGLRGLECMVGIPGSVGGNIKQNAGGAFGDIGSVAKAVHLMDRTGYKFTREREEIYFGYRTTNIMAKFIVGAEFSLTPDDPEQIGRSIKEVWMFKKTTQPINTRNAGCVFKNPRAMSSGALIERAGLMNKSVGGAHVSEKHANFIVANSGSTSKDVQDLIQLIRKTVNDKFGVELELEIQIWP
jgi:UDP-N-acetylmuramate dehydrogenase